MVGKDGGKKGKSPMDPGPSTTPVSNLNHATPTEKEPTPIRNLSPRLEEEEGGEETFEIGQGRTNGIRGSRRDVQFRCWTYLCLRESKP